MYILKIETANIGFLNYSPQFEKTIEVSYKNPVLKQRWMNFQETNKCCGTKNIEHAWMLYIKDNPMSRNMSRLILNETEVQLFQSEIMKTIVSSEIMEKFIPKFTNLLYYSCPVNYGYQVSCSEFIERNIVDNTRKFLLFGHFLIPNLSALLLLVFFSYFCLPNVKIKSLKENAQRQHPVVT